MYMAEFFRLRLKPIRGLWNVLSGLQLVLKKDNGVTENSASHIEMGVSDFTILILLVCIWNAYMYLACMWYVCVAAISISLHILYVCTYVYACAYDMYLCTHWCACDIYVTVCVFMMCFYAVRVRHAFMCVCLMVKRLPAMRETRVRSLGWEDLLEKEIATHSSTLAWRIPRTEEPGRLQSMGSQRVGHDWATSLSLSHVCTKFAHN